MRLILSRKGFDSAAGGCPSPVFPDGSLLSLPIPDRSSSVRFEDISWRGRNVGGIAEALSRGKVKRTFGAHVDPDLRRDAIRRRPGWRPSLGQVGPSQGHLARQGVGPGDLFLFFGLFRRVDADLTFVGPRFHAIWGWLQVAEAAGVDAVVRDGGRRWSWAGDHPHLHREADPSNTLYVAAPRLKLRGLRRTVAGSGTFDRLTEPLVLTARDGHGVTDWSLPLAFLPDGREPLSYHRDADRWRRRRDEARLRAVAKGQEFVLDLDQYPEVGAWIGTLFSSGVGRRRKAASSTGCS